MTLIRRLRCVARLMDVVTTQDSLIVAQRTLISQMREQLDRQALSHVRELQGMTAAWLIHHESPEVDLRDDLAALDRDLSVQIAKLEEHVL